ncbi:MAG: ATP-binding protein, partial [Oceanidesulfovibrio sp.]
LGLRGLGDAGGPAVADLPSMPLPAADTVQRFDDEMTEAENALLREESELTRIENELAARQRELERARRVGDLPTKQALEQARALRDAGWDLIKRRWLGKDPGEEAVLHMLEAFRDAGIGTEAAGDLSTMLAAGFKSAMHHSDSVADALWQRAQQLARVMELETDIRQMADELETVRIHRDAAAEALQVVREQWRELWRPASILAGRPREMASVLQKVVSLKDRMAAVRDEELTIAGLREQRDRIHALLARGLEQAGHAGVPARSVSALVMQGRSVAEEMAERGRCKRALVSKVNESRVALETSQAKAERAGTAMAEWRSRWAKAVAPLRLGPETSTEEVREYVETIGTVCDKLADMADKERRLIAMREDYDDYSARVRDVSNRAAPDLTDEAPAETAILELSSRLENAAKAKSEQDRLKRQREDAAAELESASRAREAARDQLATLVAEAGCAEASELPELEELSRRKAELEQERTMLERQLSVYAAGEELERFIEGSLSLDQDQLAARLEQAKADMKALAVQRDEYLKEITRTEGELAAMQGESKAAEVRQEIAAEAARLQSEVDRYVRLTVAAQALRKEMERYRKDNQGPVLRAAGRYFESMTRGSFRGLEADYDEKGDPVLAGVRSNGDRTGVPQMSDGSRDQLYLALRLGALDGYLERNEPLPFIVDDVLVHFDDDRSAAALAVLAELSRRTQVVFFTHHEHLAELARTAVPAELLSVQSL